MANTALIVVGGALVVGVGVAIALSGKKVKVPSMEPADDDDVNDNPDKPDVDEPPATGKRARLEQLMRLADLPEDWQEYFLITAFGESGFNNLVGLGRPEMFPPWAKPNLKASKKIQDAEAVAALKAYNRAIKQDRYGKCGNPWPKSRYVFGSGGNFGGLPSNMLHAWTGTKMACADPWLVFEQEAGLVFAIAMAKRIVGGKAFQKDPKFKWVRVAWASVDLIGNQAFLAKKIGKWRGHAQTIGIAPSVLDAKPSHLPKFDYVKLYEHLKGGMAEPDAPVETWGHETESGLLLVGVNSATGNWGVFGQPVEIEAVEAWLRSQGPTPPQLVALGVGGKSEAEKWLANLGGAVA